MHGPAWLASIGEGSTSAVEIAIVFAVIVVVAVGGALLARKVRHPEDTASHTDTGRGTTSERFEEGPGAGRPAGPDAEDPIGPTRAP